VSSAPALKLANFQSDSVLDNLPPLVEKNGRWVLPAKRLSLDSVKRAFLHLFPAGFADPDYLSQERDYKLAAHLKFQELLGLDHARTLLVQREFRLLAVKGLSVLSAVNMLSPFESAAFHDAMQDDNAVETLFTSLLNLLDVDPLSERTFTVYANAVCRLPAERGKVATWPVATIFPYLANPNKFMFLKPLVTKAAAETLGFDLKYDATPNWTTYEALLRMGTVYLGLLEPLGARDFVDVQSFIYVSCGGYDGVAATAVKANG
jgi:hypothetical protein